MKFQDLPLFASLVFWLQVCNLNLIDCICDARLFKSQNGQAFKVAFGQNKYAYIDASRESNSPAIFFLVDLNKVTYCLRQSHELVDDHLGNLDGLQSNTALSQQFQELRRTFGEVRPCFVYKDGRFSVKDQSGMQYESLPKRAFKIRDPNSNFQFVLNGIRKSRFHSFLVPGTDFFVRITTNNKLYVGFNRSEDLAAIRMVRHKPRRERLAEHQQLFAQPDLITTLTPPIPMAPMVRYHPLPLNLINMSNRVPVPQPPLGPIGPPRAAEALRQQQLQQQQQQLEDLNNRARSWRPFDGWTPFH